jgi:hypothetical protein
VVADEGVLQLISFSSVRVFYTIINDLLIL